MLFADAFPHRLPQGKSNFRSADFAQRNSSGGDHSAWPWLPQRRRALGTWVPSAPFMIHELLLSRTETASGSHPCCVVSVTYDWPTFTAVTRVQIPSGTPNLFKSLRGTATFGAGTKRHNSVANFWPGLPNRECFRASGAVLVGTKRHMQFSQIRRLQPQVRETGE